MWMCEGPVCQAAVDLTPWAGWTVAAAAVMWVLGVLEHQIRRLLVLRAAVKAAREARDGD